MTIILLLVIAALAYDDRAQLKAHYDAAVAYIKSKKPQP